VSDNVETVAKTFTAQDASNMLAIAQRAPLQNMAEAAAVSALLEKFKAWYESTQS
jgi:hypothetical protein